MLAPEVAPRNTMIGLFLPYTPLHHLLLAEVDGPLVMTSGNRADEPIAFRNDDAVARLGDIADLFLLHDREIEARCDDSVAAVIAGHGVVFRRSRGFVPRPVMLSRPVARPILACGAQLKNTFCFAAGDSAWLGPHVGDLDNLETYDSYRDGVARLPARASFLRASAPARWDARPMSAAGVPRRRGRPAFPLTPDRGPSPRTASRRGASARADG